MTKKEKEEYNEIIKILDENDKKVELENDKIKKERGLIPVKYDPLNNWEVTTFPKEEIKNLYKSIKKTIDKYANK